MSKQTTIRGALIPAGVILATAVFSGIGYFGSRTMDSEALRPAMAAVLGTTYFLSIVFGVSVVFIIAYVNGVSFKRRILAASVTPFVWMTKDVLLLIQSYPLVQAVYWYLNPLNFGLVFFMIVQMGTGTLIARTILKRKGYPVRVFSAAPIFTVLIGLGLTVFIFTWGHGENSYVIFLAGFRKFFGSGI